MTPKRCLNIPEVQRVPYTAAAGRNFSHKDPEYREYRAGYREYRAEYREYRAGDEVSLPTDVGAWITGFCKRFIGNQEYKYCSE